MKFAGTETTNTKPLRWGYLRCVLETRMVSRGGREDVAGEDRNVQGR